MAAKPACRVKAHPEGVTLACYDSKRRLVTCGEEGEVKTYHNLPESQDDDPIEFDLSTSRVSAMTCYLTPGGLDVIAVAMDDNTIQAFSTEGDPEGLLMRFTSSVTSLAVNRDHTYLAAGSSEFIIKVLELKNLPSSFSLVGHEAPILSVNFNFSGDLLGSSCCDGTVKVWSLKGHECVHTLHILPKANDVSLAPSACQFSWEPSGNLLAVPVGSEVKFYKCTSRNSVFTLSDRNYHKEGLNVVRWSPCGGFLACGDVAGCISIWNVNRKTVALKMENENHTGITALEWDPRGLSSPHGNQLAFADKSGYVGVFEGVYPPEEELTNRNADPLAEDSLLMEGIPADSIFDDDFDDMINDREESNDKVGGAHIGEVGSGQGRKQRRISSDDEDDGDNPDMDHQSEGMDLSQRSHGDEERRGGGVRGNVMGSTRIKFNDKMIEAYQTPWQPSATPTHLQHRFMVYNLVGVVRCHDDEDIQLIEVDFHDSSTHHSFSLPNHLSHNMAALNHQALVLACQKTEDQASQLQCVHFGSWDSHKDWSFPLPNKESIVAIAVGNDWIAVATNKQTLRLFTIGGVQREVISVPGHVITMAAWGPRLSIVYQVPPCTSGVFSMTVWVLDVQRKKQVHLPHTLPLSQHSELRWIGFSEEGCLITHDSKGIVRIHGDNYYGGSAWIPVLDTTKQLGSKSDHYFIVGMTHQPDELRGILCKGLEYPPVQPRPVMSSLPLKIPLCEPELERTQHECEYLHASLINPPTQTRATGQLVQILMKMFAFACKSGHEFKAYEIAGMMPDIQSMNLAMTYASRSHHLQLARQINELIQQKSLHESDSELSEEDDPIGQDWTNWNGHARDSEGRYSLKRGVSFPPTNQRLSNDSKKTAPRLSSKFGRYMDEVKKGKFIHTGGVRGRSHTHSNTEADRESGFPPEDDDSLSNDCATTNGADLTAELFSGSESGQFRNEEESVQNGNEEDSLEAEEGGVGGDSHTPKAFGDISLGKRTNPFKVATPVSKKITASRKTGFLDNITACVDEDRRKKEEILKNKKERRCGTGHVTSSAAKGGKGNKRKKTTSAPQGQKNLKGSFFKSKMDDSEQPSVPAEAPEENGGSVATQSQANSETQSHDSTELSCDPDGVSPETEEGKKMTSSQKLAAFAFKST